MQYKKEVDIVLMIIFIVLFFGFGSYIGLKHQEGEKIINFKSDNVWDAAEDAKELPKKPIKEMPAVIEEEFKIIEIKNTKFNPSELNISKGTIVYWVNKDDRRNYQVYEKSANQKFNSLQIQPDESFNYTFNEEGEYKYGDAIFTYMSGIIRVS